MKARVKATREIVEVMYSHISQDEGCDIIWYVTSRGAYFSKEELEFIDTGESLDYWTRLEHQYTGMAMQGLISRVHWPEVKDIIEYAVKIAHALVEEYKKEERK